MIFLQKVVADFSEKKYQPFIYQIIVKEDEEASQN